MLFTYKYNVLVIECVFSSVKIVTISLFKKYNKVNEWINKQTINKQY